MLAEQLAGAETEMLQGRLHRRGPYAWQTCPDDIDMTHRNLLVDAGV
ncbi:hypothetical protein [Actinomadura parvosata]